MQELRMTARQVYENLLRELNKVNAPSLHLEDYNYFINRGITEYINRRYNLYDTSQQTTDDLQVLTDSATIDAVTGRISDKIGKAGADDADAILSSISGLPGEIDLPLLVEPYPEENPVYYIQTIGVEVSKLNNVPAYNQITIVFDKDVAGDAVFKNTSRSEAVAGNMVLLGNADSSFVVPASSSGLALYGKSFRLDNGILIEIPFSGDANWLSQVPIDKEVDGFPSKEFSLPENYYHMLNCIVNFETEAKFKCYPIGSTQPFTARRLTSDMYAGIMNNAFMKPDYKRPYYLIQNQEGKVTPVMEIRAGNFEDVFKLKSINIDYLKVPQIITLTTLQRDNLSDTSQVMEFPNYVSNEIIKITTSLVMENASDPRLQTHIPVNMSIPQQPPGVPQPKK